MANVGVFTQRQSANGLMGGCAIVVKRGAMNCIEIKELQRLLINKEIRQRRVIISGKQRRQIIRKSHNGHRQRAFIQTTGV